MGFVEIQALLTVYLCHIAVQALTLLQVYYIKGLTCIFYQALQMLQIIYRGVFVWRAFLHELSKAHLGCRYFSHLLVGLFFQNRTGYK